MNSFETLLAVRNLACLHEDEIQKHKDALLKAPLGAPTELDSGNKFAELIMGAFKDGSTSAWEKLADPEPAGV